MSIAEAPDIDAEADVANRLEWLSPQLIRAARTAKEGTEKGSPDRLLAVAIMEAAIRLVIQIKEYARQLRGLERRRIEGFALGFDDPEGRRWYLHHALHWGNLMRCDRVEFAALWPDLQSLREWAGLAIRPRGEDSKGRPWPAPFEQLDEYDLSAYPVRIQVGEPTLIRARIQSL